MTDCRVAINGKIVYAFRLATGRPVGGGVRPVGGVTPIACFFFQIISPDREYHLQNTWLFENGRVVEVANGCDL
jgi:hypothetical protein